MALHPAPGRLDDHKSGKPVRRQPGEPVPFRRDQTASASRREQSHPAAQIHRFTDDPGKKVPVNGFLRIETPDTAGELGPGRPRRQSQFFSPAVCNQDSISGLRISLNFGDSTGKDPLMMSFQRFLPPRQKLNHIFHHMKSFCHAASASSSSGR